MKEFLYHCKKCDLVLNHKATAQSGEVVYKMKCLTCNTVATYKAPKSTSQFNPSILKSQPRAKPKAPSKAKKIMVASPDAARVNYNIRMVYFPGDVMVHPSFGEGLIESIQDNIATCNFPDGTRKLMTNRR